MSVMARWNSKTWEVSSRRVAALNSISAGIELDTDKADDKAGFSTKALKPQTLSFDFNLATVAGCDVRAEYESWTNIVGQCAPFFLSGRRFGPANYLLTSVSLGDTILDDFGRILQGKITVALMEQVKESGRKKSTSASSRGSNSGDKRTAGVATYNELGIRASALNVGASSSDKASMKPYNMQLTAR